MKYVTREAELAAHFEFLHNHILQTLYISTIAKYFFAYNESSLCIFIGRELCHTYVFSYTHRQRHQMHDKRDKRGFCPELTNNFIV